MLKFDGYCCAPHAVERCMSTLKRCGVEASLPVQMAVCALELLPEALKCKEDWRLIQGIGFGSVVMLATLWAGV